MQKHVNLVDLVKSFPTNILLQNLASIQKRTRPVKFAHLSEKSGKGSISKLSTKAARPPPDATLLQQLQWSEDRRAAAEQRIQELTALASKLQSRLDAITTAGGLDALKPPPPPSTEREDGIDRFIRQYLKEHPDYKVQV